MRVVYKYALEHIPKQRAEVRHLRWILLKHSAQILSICYQVGEYQDQQLAFFNCLISFQDLFKKYTMFEKRFGDRSGIEDVIVSKRKFQYEEVSSCCVVA